MNDKKLSICICVFNKYNFTRSCLSDLSHLSSDHEIIIIDNGSSDETQKQLEGSKEIIYYRNDENRGFAWGSNKACSLSSARNVMMLNNDIRVKSNKDSWTQEIIKYCELDNVLVGPTMGLLDKEFNFIKEANQYLPGLSYMSGWCLSGSKKTFDKIKRDQDLGPFCEDYFSYFEDTTLSFIARKLDIKFQIVDIPVVHFGKQTSSQLNTYKLYNDSRKIFIKQWKGKV